MPRRSDKRERLLVAAGDVIHQRGYGATTLAIIADEAEVPLGNVYYYYKTKSDILSAVLKEHRQRVSEKIAAASKAKSPQGQLISFLDSSLVHKEKVARFGCPYGTLSQELEKLGLPQTEQSKLLIDEQRRWMEQRFRELGHGARSGALALELICAMQGACVVSQTLKDPEIMTQRFSALTLWIQSLIQN
ncbi:MAG: TetR/AcrR family transcriptional regulator [Planctomycetota bacterium]|nr:TetR/AcrR family transcriptional regulator [Planctomycetota bacterium]